LVFRVWFVLFPGLFPGFFPGFFPDFIWFIWFILPRL
jgi:hypothetical protein